MQMEVPVVESVKKYQMMNEHMFDHLDGKNIDLVYENFNSIFMALIAQLDGSETIAYDTDLIKFLKEDSKFLKTFYRGMLKWCIEEEGEMVNTSLVDILKGIESYFVCTIELLLSCPTTSSTDEYDESTNSGLDQIIEDGLSTTSSTDDEYDESTNSMVPRIAKAYLLVFTSSPYSSPPTHFMNIIISKEESVVEFMNQVLENLLYATARFFNETTIGLMDKLVILGSFFPVTKNWIIPEKWQELLVCVETVVEKIACYSYLSFHYDRVKELHVQIEAKNLEFEMLTVILKVASSVLQLDSSPDPLTHEVLLGYVDCVEKKLTELSFNREIFVSPDLMEVQFRILGEELRFLERLLISYPSKKDGEGEILLDVRVNVEAVARNIGSFLYQAVEKGNRIMSVENGIGPELTDLVEKVKLIRAQVIDTIFLVDFNRFGWKFPQTDPLGNLKYLINNLKEYLMDCKTHDLIMDWKDQVQIILDDLIMFESFLKKIRDDNIILDYELEDLSIRINNSSYEADYIINFLYARVCPVSYISVSISDFIERMKLIKTDVLEIIEKKSMDKKISEDRNHVVFQSLFPTIDVMIGFEDEMKLLKESLVSDRKELDVVSITGMPGLGKTTLAKKVYEDPLIASHFQLRAWCCVSQEYNKKGMLLDILSSVLELNDFLRRKSAEDLSVILHKQLTGRRYLILVDDVWNIEAWDDLRTSFPNNNIGSRIMLTSRNKVIGIQAIYHTKPLELRFLSDDESWDLLKATVFHSKPCPLDFLHVGKKIAGKCKGLPLVVVVVARLLLKSAEEELGFWKQVEENLSSHIGSDSQGHLMHVLELSYKFLPNYLRPLFLYLGAFPEDQEISVENLIWLWIAEGFIQKSELMTLEAQARTHLMDLIDRSLVMVAKRSYNGNVKTCRVHDLLHEFCLETAKKDSFLQQIHVYDKSIVPDSIISQWRLSMCLNRRDLDAPSPLITPPLHSFLFFNMNKRLPLWNDVVKSVFCMSKLLSVLHLESTTIEDELKSDLMMMVHLRYISVWANWESIPSSIFSFWKLEILIIYGVSFELTVPAVIWTMVKLRHLHINDRACFEFDDDDDASKLESLETLSTLAIYRGHEKKLIRRLPNLRKLRCIFCYPRDNYSQFPNLKPFDQLESLKLSYNDTYRSSRTLNLPTLSLKKLTLSYFRLKWDAISTIVEKLPNLEVLKLGLESVVDNEWNMGDVEFPNLKFLKLQSLNIKTWSVSPENLPALEKLVLERCKQLKEIPDSVGEFYSLEKIELLWCNRSAGKSAKQIQEDQKDAGNELLKVHVYPPNLDL